MKYNLDAKNGITWTPLIIRNDDKNEPQFFLIANNIWKTIHEKITENMISGEIDYRNIQVDNDKDEYYDNELTSSCSISLRKFHNYVKLKLISEIAKLNTTNQILDTSIGRGGDINKYLDESINTNFILDQIYIQ